MLALVVLLAVLGWSGAAMLAHDALSLMSPILLLSVQIGISAGLLALQQGFSAKSPAAPGGIGEAGFVYVLAFGWLVERAAGTTLQVAAPELLVLAGLAALVLRWPVSGRALLRAVAVLAGIFVAVGLGESVTGERLVAAGMLASVAATALTGARFGLATERLLLAALLLLLLPLALFRAGELDLALVPPMAWLFAMGSGVMLYAASYALGAATRSARSFVWMAPIIGITGAAAGLGGGVSAIALLGAGLAILALLQSDAPRPA